MKYDMEILFRRVVEEPKTQQYPTVFNWKRKDIHGGRVEFLRQFLYYFPFVFFGFPFAAHISLCTSSVECPKFVQLFLWAKIYLQDLLPFVSYSMKKNKGAIVDRVSKRTGRNRDNQIGVSADFFSVKI